MSSTLFYKALRTGKMWDTWLYYRHGTYYLFNLFSPFDGGGFCGIAMATSVDGVHWDEHGAILEKADDVTWLGTGSVWQAPAIGTEDRFILNFSEWRGKGQTIFFAESNDLLHWRRLGNEYEFQPDARWYRTDGRWDCIFTIDRPDGGFYGYWTANPLDFTGFGFGESLDGLSRRASIGAMFRPCPKWSLALSQGSVAATTHCLAPITRQRRTTRGCSPLLRNRLWDRFAP